MASVLVMKVMECVKTTRVQHQSLLDSNDMQTVRVHCNIDVSCINLSWYVYILPQCINQLEGMRCGLEVFSRLIHLSCDKSITFVWTHDQLNEMLKSWELAAIAASKSSQFDSGIGDKVNYELRLNGFFCCDISVLGLNSYFL